jgi:hypothetical protein
MGWCQMHRSMPRSQQSQGPSASIRLRHGELGSQRRHLHAVASMAASRLQAQVVAGSRPIKPLRPVVHVQAKLTSNHTGTQWCSSVATAPDPCPMHPPARFSGSDLFSPRVVRTSSSMHTVPSPSAIRCRCCAAPIPPSVLDGFGLCVQPLVEGREGGREVRGPSSRVDVTSQPTSARWDKSGLQFAS